MIKLKILLVGLFLITSASLFSQSYEKTLTAPMFDVVSGSVLTSDGGIILAGSVEAFGSGGQDILVTRIDGVGNILWSKAVGTTSNDSCQSIIITTDSFIVVLGNTYGAGLGNSDVYINKLDMSGQLIWTKAIGDVNYDWGVEAVATPDSGFVICGYMDFPPALVPVISNNTVSNTFLRKYDKLGTVVWSQYYATNTCHFRVYDLIQQVNGDFVMLFNSECQINPPTYQSSSRIMRVNSAGQLLWMYSGFPSSYYNGACLAEPDNGTLFVLSSGNGQVITLKIDSTGTPVYSYRYGFYTSMQAWSVFSMTNGGYLITGSVTPSQFSRTGFLFLRLGANAYPLWTKCSYTDLPANFNGHTKWRTSDAALITDITYYGPQPDIAVNLTDTLGNVVCSDDSMMTTYTNVQTLPVLTTEPMINTNPALLLNGSPATTVTSFVYAIGSMCSSVPGGLGNLSIDCNARAFPNPSSQQIMIDWTDHTSTNRSISIISCLGETVYHDSFTGNTKVVNVSALASGIYSVEYRADDIVLKTEKLVID